MNEPSQERIPLPAALIQSVVDYLAERPYRDVAGLINALLTEVNAHRTAQPSEEPKAS